MSKRDDRHMHRLVRRVAVFRVFHYVLYTILYLVKLSIEWYIVSGILFGFDRKVSSENGIFPYKSIGKNEYFCNNSGRARPIRLIFELDRDLDKIKLCTKFYENRLSLSKVIVYTDGRPDGHTDRFYMCTHFFLSTQKGINLIFFLWTHQKS